MFMKPRHVYPGFSGGLRLSANQECWPRQAKLEAVPARVLRAEGWTVVRVHPYDKQKRPGFIGFQKPGMNVFRRLDLI